MSEPLSVDELAVLLPGTWDVAASNFPMWLDRRRRNPTFTYGVLSTDPLVLSDDVAYVTGEGDGEVKHVLGRDTWRRDHFRWRGRGRLFIATSRWTIAGVSADNDVAVVRFAKTLFTPSGVDVITRQNRDHDDIRAIVAADTQALGLTPEEFGSLTWLGQFPGHH